MPAKRMTKAQARAYVRGWEAANRRERVALRSATPQENFRQLCALFASADLLDWKQQLAEEDAAGHTVWSRLQKAYLER